MNEVKYLIVELDPYKIGEVLGTYNRKIRLCEIEGTISIYDDMICVLSAEYKPLYRMISCIPEVPKNLGNLQKILWWYIYSTYKMKVWINLNEELNIVVKPSYKNLAREYEV